MLNDLYQILDPVAFSIGPFAVRWYGLAYVAGFLLAGLIIYRTAKRWKVNLDLDTLSTVVIVIIVGILLGGRLGYCIFYGDGEYLKDPIEVLRIQNGGMSFHGALFLGALLGVIVCRKIGMPALTFADLACVGIPVGLFFGRVANFINGELWGAPTDLPWGVVFGGYAGTVPRHPSQLYEAFLEGVVIFVILFILSRKNPPLKQGTYTGLFLVLYGVFRIAVEFVREPDVQVGYLFGDWLTMGMVLSVPLLFIGAGLLIYAAVAKRDQEGLQYIEEEEEPDVQKKNRKLAPNESEYVLNEDGEYVLNENDYVPSFHGFKKIPKRNKYGKVGVVYELELDPELFSSDDDLDEFDDYQEYAPFDELDEYQSEQAIDELDEPEYAYDSDYDYEYDYEYQPTGEEISEYADIESSEFAEEDWRGDMFGQVQEIKPHSFAGAVKKVSDAILSTYDTPPFPIVPASTSAEITAELEAVAPEEIESAEVEVADVEAIEAEATEVETTEPEAAETEATVTEPTRAEETEVETSETEATTASDAGEIEMTELQLSDGGTEEVVMPEVEAEVVEEPEVIKAKDEVVEAKPIKAKVKETLHMEDFPDPDDVLGADKLASAEDIPAPPGTENVAARKATNKPTKRKRLKKERVKEKKSKLSGFDLTAELDRLREAAQANLPKENDGPKSNLLPVTKEEEEKPLLQEPKFEETEVAESKAEAEAAPEVEPAPEFAPEPAAVPEPEPEPSAAPEPSAEPDPEPEMRPVPEPKPEPVPEVEITETSKEEQKEEPKTEAKAKAEEESKEETKEEVQEDVAHEPKKVPAPEPENLEEAKEEPKEEIKEDAEEEAKKEVKKESKEEIKEQNTKPKDKSLEEAEQTIDDVLSLKLFGKNSDKSRANMRDVLTQRIVKNEKNEKDEKKSYVKNRIKKGKFFKR